MPTWPKVSIINLTWERYGVTEQCLTKTIERIEYPNVEWLVWDNGSKDERVRELIKSLGPDYFRSHHENIGVAKAKNQLLLRASGEYLMSIDPDIIYPERWVTRLVEAHRELSNVGLLGYDPGVGPGERVKKTVAGRKVVERVACWGGYFFHESIMEDVGYIYEGYGLYAFTTGDFALRVDATGRDSYYIGNSKHLGHKNRASGTYNKAKRGEKDKYMGLKRRRYKGIREGAVDIYVPPPELI